MVTGAATAGLVELEPHGDRGRAALYAVLVQGGGSSAGPLLAGALAQWAPEPRVLCYLVALVLALAAAVAVMTIPEPAPGGGRWRFQRPSVPAEIRVGFWRACLTATTVWMVAALYLSVVPSYAAKLLDTGNLALLGAIAGSLLAASCAAQLVAARRDGLRRASSRSAWRSSPPAWRRSCSPSRCIRWRPSSPARCWAAPATASPSWARRTTSTSSPRSTAAAR